MLTKFGIVNIFSMLPCEHYIFHIIECKMPYQFPECQIKDKKHDHDPRDIEGHQFLILATEARQFKRGDD